MTELKNKIYTLEKEKRYLEKKAMDKGLSMREQKRLDVIKKSKIKIMSGYKIVKVLENEKQILLSNNNDEDRIKASGIQKSIELIKRMLITS